MTQQTTTRPDIDIEADIIDIILRYPPLAADRHHINITVQNGVVHVSGNTISGINRGYLLQQLATVPNVVGVDDTLFYDDNTITREAGQLIPTGVMVNTTYGVVVLSGKQPDDVDTVAMKVAQIPGVVRVVTIFQPHRN